jgi:DNA-binding XRE family transcriptional regulator
MTASNLRMAVLSYRNSRKINVRDMARAIGINYSSLCKFERGGEIRGRQYSRILLWLLK